MLQPELDLDLWGEARLRASARLRGDAYDHLEPGRPPNASVSSLSRRYSLGRRTVAELRELYVSIPAGDALVRLGKQHIVWGTADGLKVLDVVNPQDFREFILDDFEDSRIPLWALDVEVPLGPGSLQLVWLPDTTYHVLPERGALYELTSPLLLTPIPPGSALEVRDVDRPNRFPADSDVGARYVGFVAGWDFTLNYLYHYDDAPVIFRRPGVSPASWLIEPEYRRTHLAGLTFSNAFGDLTLRGELGYSFGRRFPVDDAFARTSHRKLDELSYVIGLDWYGIRETLLSVQLFQSLLTGHGGGEVVRERSEWNATFLARRDFLNDALTADLQWIVSLNRGDGLIRARVSYELRDGLRLWLSGDFFHGRRSGIFGQFGARDRLSVGMEWTFSL